MLAGKHILLGITGSIAAYKAAALARLLVKAGAQVKVLMTPMAKRFITPLTMATLTRNPILVDFFDPENGAWNSHVSLGCWADLYLIAPASANTLAKMATGVADNLLLTTYLSARCPVMAAPAMDLDMYMHDAVRSNLDTLGKRGVILLEPASGELASGLSGKGRMMEPEDIMDRVVSFFAAKGSLSSRKILITSGPTKEAIDPVRFISNHSSGRMGAAIADELASRGADVTVVSGPSPVRPSLEAVKVVDVVSAAQMYDAFMSLYSSGDFDAAVFCAAVADYSPSEASPVKLKKEDSSLVLKLSPTKDIAFEAGKRKRSGCVHVGFALETDGGEDSARDKMERKNLDMVVLNSLTDEGAGFGCPTNKVTFFYRNAPEEAMPLKSKQDVASDLADRIEKLILC